MNFYLNKKFFFKKDTWKRMWNIGKKKRSVKKDWLFQCWLPHPSPLQVTPSQNLVCSLTTPWWVLKPHSSPVSHGGCVTLPVVTFGIFYSVGCREDLFTITPYFVRWGYQRPYFPFIHFLSPTPCSIIYTFNFFVSLRLIKGLSFLQLCLLCFVFEVKDPVNAYSVLMPI